MSRPHIRSDLDNGKSDRMWMCASLSLKMLKSNAALAGTSVDQLTEFLSAFMNDTAALTLVIQRARTHPDPEIRMSRFRKICDAESWKAECPLPVSHYGVAYNALLSSRYTNAVDRLVPSARARNRIKHPNFVGKRVVPLVLARYMASLCDLDDALILKQLFIPAKLLASQIDTATPREIVQQAQNNTKATETFLSQKEMQNVVQSTYASTMKSKRDATLLKRAAPKKASGSGAKRTRR